MNEELLNQEENLDEEITEEADYEVEDTEEVADSETDSGAEQTVEESEDSSDSFDYEADKQNAINKVTARYKRKLEQRDAEIDPLLHTLRQIIDDDEGELSIEEINNRFRGIYEENGQTLAPYVRKESRHDAQILAEAEAKEIIDSGNDAMIEEYDRLKDKHRTYREDVVFNKLQAELTIKGAEIELEKNGKDSSVLREQNFIDFASRYRESESLLDIYDDYMKLNGRSKAKEQKRPAGTMKSNKKTDRIKKRYTSEEADRFTLDELLKNPDLLEAIDNSVDDWIKN